MKSFLSTRLVHLPNIQAWTTYFEDAFLQSEK